LEAVEKKYRSLFLGQFLGARERKKSGEVSKQNAPKFSFDDGLQVLINSLDSHLFTEIETSEPINALENHGGEWVCHSGSGALPAQPFSAVLLAVPAYALARLTINGDTAFDSSLFHQVSYPPVASVVLGFKRKDVGHPLNGFGVLVPEKEKLNILGALFSSSLFPNRAPEGEVTLTTYIGGARAPGLVSLSNAELVEIARSELSRLLDITGGTTFHHVAAYPRAIPQYNVGYGVFKDRMNDLETQEPGVFVAGHCRDGISLGDSIISGHNVAARIEQYLANRPLHKTCQLSTAA
jgi:oxygen-dependent protoporphyrinogen oxidase